MSVLSYFGFTKKAELSPAPSDDFWYKPVGVPNASGISVDESVALTYSACWAATRLLAGCGGMLPFNLHRKTGGGGSTIAAEHRVHRLLHDAPNNDMSSMLFRSSRINHQVNRGNCFAEIIRSRGGQVFELQPIHASRIPVHTNIVRRNGKLVYIVNNDDGTKTEIKQENMFHVPSIISEDGIVGRGVVEHARLTIGAAIAKETHGAAYFNNGGRPPLVIKNAAFKTPEASDAFRRMWAEQHGGAYNAGKPALLPPGADATALPFNAQESQFLESSQHSIEDIARWYGVPPHMIQHLLRATNNNIEHQGIDFVKYSLMPWLKLWEQEVWRKLLTEDEQKVYYAKFNVDALERGDLASRTTASVQQIFNGLLTINKWAEREDMNPIGEYGDIHWIQQAMVPLEIAAKGPQPQSPAVDDEPSDAEEPDVQEEPEEYGLATFTASIESLRTEFANQLASIRPDLSPLTEQLSRQNAVQKQLATAMLRDAMGRMLSIEIHNVKHIAEKPSKFDQRLKDFYAKHAVSMHRSLREPVSVVLSISGDSRNVEDVVFTLTSGHVNESLKRLDALLDCLPEELPSRVDECVSTWHEERATVTV